MLLLVQYFVAMSGEKNRCQHRNHSMMMIMMCSSRSLSMSHWRWIVLNSIWIILFSRQPRNRFLFRATMRKVSRIGSRSSFVWVDLRLAAEFGRCLLEQNQELQSYIGVLQQQIDDKQSDMKVRGDGQNKLLIESSCLGPWGEISLDSRATGWEMQTNRCIRCGQLWSRARISCSTSR